MIKIIMNGFQGNMGKVVCEIVNKDSECEIIAGIDSSGKKSAAQFPTFIDINNCNINADVVIDFSINTAVPKLLGFCVNKKIPIVICTTDLDKTIIEKIDKSSKVIPIFQSYNMSIGINLLSKLLKDMSNLLYNCNFDIEIIEKHHNKKIDSPSGTALLMANSIEKSINKNFNYIFDRSKLREKRSKNEIGIHSIRGGTIIGEHSIIFSGEDEIIELKHTALSKKIFAVGAINAAKYIIKQKPGLYDMEHLMNKNIKKDFIN